MCKRPESCPRDISKIISLLSLRYNPLHRSTLHVFIQSSTSFAQYNDRQGKTVQLGLPALPYFPGILDAFKVSIANALPPLTVEQVYQGVDYGKVDVLTKTAIGQVCIHDHIFALLQLMSLTLDASRLLFGVDSMQF
jgi:hypothetical protein